MDDMKVSRVPAPGTSTSGKFNPNYNKNGSSNKIPEKSFAAILAAQINSNLSGEKTTIPESKSKEKSREEER